MIRRLIILLLIVGCGTEPEDACGVAGGDGTTCADCAGVSNGDAVEDMCSICDSDATNDCVQDCAGVWGGNSYLDECGGCDANVNNDCIQDCAGEWGGGAVLSGCDNLCNSTATEDNCGICDGDGSDDVGCGCFEPAPSGCDNECGSTLVDDACGVCDGDGSDDVGCGCFEPAPSGCDNECGSTLVDDACGVCDGDGSTCEGLWNVYYDVDVPISGFQFQVKGGTIINASGGAATEAGLSVSNSSSTVVAFSLSGNTIPSGTGTLISLDMEGDSNSFCISNLVLSDIGGNVIPAIIVNCNTIKYSDN